MSTAIGHGLVDPKRRGKPVSHTNKVGRVRLTGLDRGGRLCPWLVPFPRSGEGPEPGNVGSSAPGWGRPEYRNLESFWAYVHYRIERESG